MVAAGVSCRRQNQFFPLWLRVLRLSGANDNLTSSRLKVMDSTYIYIPLSMPDSIRLLKLEPGDSNALIEGTFTIVSLSDPGLSYGALSYTWGNPLDEDSRFFEPHNDSKNYFNCGGKRIEILRNLRDALWQLRQHNDISKKNF